MQKKDVEELITSIRNDVRMDMAVNLIDCERYVIIMEHPKTGITHCASSPSDVRDLLPILKEKYKA